MPPAAGNRFRRAVTGAAYEEHSPRFQLSTANRASLLLCQKIQAGAIPLVAAMYAISATASASPYRPRLFYLFYPVEIRYRQIRSKRYWRLDRRRRRPRKYYAIMAIA